MKVQAHDRIARERTALRRMAVLAARGAPPEEIYAAVTAEIGRLLGVSQAVACRYDAGKTVTSVGRWNAASAAPWGDLYTTPLGGRNVSTLIFETGRPARIDYSQATGPLADLVRGHGGRSGVGVPINVGGRLWGHIIVISEGGEPLAADTEVRLAGFTELVGTAIANAQARVELRSYADEQAALRRVATLVAGGSPPEKVFAVVTEEIGRVMSADFAQMKRYDADGCATAVGQWSRGNTPYPCAVGDRWRLGGRNVSTLVYQTGKPARIENYDDATGRFAQVARARGFRSAAGAPISVAGRLWGLVVVGSAREASLPGDAEVRLAGFTELVGTAIANAEAQAALAASRARIVAAADEARRRIEHDLHDGAQQRLVTLALQLRELQATAPPEADGLVDGLDGVVAGLDAALAELREIACGIHPTVLTEGGLGPAMEALARRCPVPVELHVQVPGRIPGQIETAAYYVACEALANAAKHAHAAAAEVTVTAGDGVLRVRVHDDGRGGAAVGGGSGLIGLKDRVEAFGGRITLRSPPGAGTTLEVRIPLEQAGHLPSALPPGQRSRTTAALFASSPGRGGAPAGRALVKDVRAMKLTVIGGTGRIGSQVVRKLTAAGHQAVPAAVSTGVDLLTGQGLDQALEGAEVAVDVADSPTYDEASLDFYRTSMTNLLAAGERAGVRHQVVLSIVGVDQVPEVDYYRAKTLQEGLLRQGPAPYSIVRATQFFEFISTVLSWTSDDATVRLPQTRLQPIAAADVVDAVVDVCTGAPLQGIRNVAGPDVFPLDELGRLTLAARQDNRTVITDNEADMFAVVAGDVLTAGPDAQLAPTHYQDWIQAVR